MDYKKTILIENVDKELWRKFVGLARYNGIKVGNLLNDVILDFVEKHKIKEIRKGVKNGM